MITPEPPAQRCEVWRLLGAIGGYLKAPHPGPIRNSVGDLRSGPVPPSDASPGPSSSAPALPHASGPATSRFAHRPVGVTSHGGLLAALGEALHTRLVRHFTPVVTKASYNVAVVFDDSAEAGNVRL